MNFHDIIRNAIAQDDLDDAVRIIQDATGITDGGYAGIHFSHLEPGDWVPLSKRERAKMLWDYTSAEFLIDIDL